MAIASYVPMELNRGEITTTESTMIPAYLISQTPGRIRLRLNKNDCHPQKIDQLVNALKEQLEIYRVRSNSQTGSLTIFYATNHWNFEKIADVLQTLNIALLKPEKKENPYPYQSEVAAEVTSFFSGVNHRVGQATEGTIDVRFLVPLGFSFLAVRQLLIKGLSLDIIPWYVFAWYAFDSFLKLHYTSPPSPVKSALTSKSTNF
ncbi:conserved hypothetical protein [Gloeothece citriformis PCC 7424]|uniref:Uncharacterized protein n=1 Tax=Gloeothece citriformis (strain PCC 7424) TaxID=65393 RepID=B7KE56_GLOC7|nr:hypothetical protein [Gloeothece citriformis]ACK71754.1 conserved hypothetical protein [Gloeothece citriformis PCC 7424]